MFKKWSAPQVEICRAGLPGEQFRTLRQIVDQAVSPRD
jgi:hypothetical protein